MIASREQRGSGVFQYGVDLSDVRLWNSGLSFKILESAAKIPISEFRFVDCNWRIDISELRFPNSNIGIPVFVISSLRFRFTDTYVTF